MWPMGCFRFTLQQISCACFWEKQSIRASWDVRLRATDSGPAGCLYFKTTWCRDELLLSVEIRLKLTIAFWYAVLGLFIFSILANLTWMCASFVLLLFFKHTFNFLYLYKTSSSCPTLFLFHIHFIVSFLSFSCHYVLFGNTQVSMLSFYIQ